MNLEICEPIPDFREPLEYTIEEIYKLYESFKEWEYQPIYVVHNGKITIDYE